MPDSSSLTLPRGGDPDRFLRQLVTTPGTTWALSHAPVHITDAIIHAIRQHGPAHVQLACWWLNYRHCEDVIGLVRSGRVLSLTLRLDASMRDRQKESTQLLDRSALPVSWGDTHAKAIAMSWPDGRCLSIMTSQADPSQQAEWWYASTCPDVHAWLTTALEHGTATPCPADLALAMRLRATPYTRPRYQQDVRALMAAHARRVSLPSAGESFVVAGPELPTLALLASVAAQFPTAPAVHLSGWWFAQRAIQAIELLERAQLIQPPHYTTSHVMDGVYGDGRASDAFARAIPAERRRFADVHAKVAILEAPGADPVTILSTGNWQPTSPSTEIAIITRDPVAYALFRGWLA